MVVQEKHPHRRWLPVAALAVVAVVAVIIAIGIWSLSASDLKRPRVVAKAQMADGSILSLHEVRFGTLHSFIPGETGPKTQADGLFSSWLPRNDARPSGIATPPATGLWLTRRDAITGEPLAFDWLSHCEVTDADGRTIEDGNAALYGYMPSFFPDPSWFYTFGERPLHARALGPSLELAWREFVAFSALPPFPHSGKTFELRIIDVDGDVVATLPVPNRMPKAEIQTPRS